MWILTTRKTLHKSITQKRSLTLQKSVQTYWQTQLLKHIILNIGFFGSGLSIFICRDVSKIDLKLFSFKMEGSILSRYITIINCVVPNANARKSLNPWSIQRELEASLAPSWISHFISRGVTRLKGKGIISVWWKLKIHCWLLNRRPELEGLSPTTEELWKW